MEWIVPLSVALAVALLVEGLYLTIGRRSFKVRRVR